jgi:hypothetical protein
VGEAMYNTMVRDEAYWEAKRQESYEYSRYWGCRTIPVKIIPGLTAQDMIEIQEKAAGVPFHHPEFASRMRKFEEDRRRERLERLKQYNH